MLEEVVDLAALVFPLHMAGAGAWGFVTSIRGGGVPGTLARTQLVLLAIVAVVVAIAVSVESLVLSLFPIQIALWGCILAIALVFVFIGVTRLHKALTRRARCLGTLQALPAAFFAVSFYFALYPPPSYYLAEFEHRTGHALPENAEVVARTASYPTFMGDYSSEAVIRLSENEFRQVMRSLPPEEGDEGCFASGSYSGVRYQPGGCWSREIRIDARIMVTYFPDDSALHFLFSQT